MRTHAVAFLKAHHDRKMKMNTVQPFFLYLPFQNIHGPHDAPLSFVNLYENRTDLDFDEKVLFGYISEMDDVVGSVVEVLRDTKEYENTLIIFSSDNGAVSLICSFCFLLLLMVVIFFDFIFFF